MKVVLFCGGLGTRLREYSELIPKPMVPIGYRPVLWHIMKYYAQHGHTDFILCLGYKADVIKQYFLEYQECITNDFVLEDGGKDITLLNSDIDKWRITFVDTGLHSNIAQRLVAVKPYLEDEELFLANYSDDLTDCSITEMIEQHRKSNAVASFLCVKPSYSFHVVKAEDEGVVTSIQSVGREDIWINGGYFVLNQEIFNYIGEDEELVEEPFNRLISESRLRAHKYTGFWGSMDTFKEKQILEDLYHSGEAPWIDLTKD